MIIDSSAILAIFFRESGAEELLSMIVDADFAGIGSPTAAEAGLVLTSRMDQNAAGSLLRFFQETGIEIVPFSELHWQRAIDAYAQEKGKSMSATRASGSFDVNVQPIASEAFPRLSLAKHFRGDLEGTSAGEMMSVEGTAEGSGAYVAIERITGTLKGRKGSFALVHNGTMRRGSEFNMIIRVVPDSGTGELTGLAGTMQIVIEGRDHSYHFDYTLPE